MYRRHHSFHSKSNTSLSLVRVVGVALQVVGVAQVDTLQIRALSLLLELLTQ
jgi:hypothetical protein